MKIGQLAQLTGVSVDTLRFYEDKGLLAPQHRSAAGYRHYAPNAVDQVRFIKTAQSLGFSLQEILAVVPDLREGQLPLHEVRERMRTKLDALDHQIAVLTAQRDDLRATMHSLGCDDATLLHAGQLLRPES
mgnify:CR=1 FL=1